MGSNQVLVEPVTCLCHQGGAAESSALRASKIGHHDGVETETYLVEDLQVRACKSCVKERVHEVCVAGTKEGGLGKFSNTQMECTSTNFQVDLYHDGGR